jgi:hypothetical protein
MTCLPQWKITQLQNRLIKLREQSDRLETIIDNAIDSGVLSGIEFDSGEGKEKSTYRSLPQLQLYQKQLWQSIENLENRLQCKGLINVGLNR